MLPFEKVCEGKTNVTDRASGDKLTECRQWLQIKRSNDDICVWRDDFEAMFIFEVTFFV